MRVWDLTFYYNAKTFFVCFIKCCRDFQYFSAILSMFFDKESSS